MPTCGGFRIGVLSSDPNTPPLVIVNVPPLQIGERQRAVVGRLARTREPSCSICGKRHAIGVAQDGDDEPFVRADGDADVVVVLEHHLVALDFRVDPRELAQRADRRP